MWLTLALDVFHNTTALTMALRILRVRIRPHLVVFAAVFGAFAAFAAGIARGPKELSMLLWLPVALCMMRICAGRENRFLKRLFRAGILLACEGFLGGVVLALHGATGSLIAAHILSVGCTTAFFVGSARVPAALPDVRCVRVICRLGTRKLELDGMVDSGNTLRDYLTNRPVIVTAMRTQQELDGVRTRLIFADTAGGRQMMLMTVPTETTLENSGRRLRVEAALAFSFAMRKDAPALVPASLFE